MRRGHWIKHNRGCEMPAECIWFDTETHPNQRDAATVVHRLWFGFGLYRRRHRGDQWTPPDWVRFETRAAFWDWVIDRCRPRSRVFMFCHNTNFDLPVLDAFGELTARDFVIKRAIIDAPPTIVTFRRGTTTITLLDTLNLWRMKLDELGAMVGTPKLVMPAADAPRAEWDRYARQDVQVLHDACLNWWRWLIDNDLGGFAPTLASQAFRSYRHRFMPHRILAHDNVAALELSRASYNGGRCECFRLGVVPGPVTVLDVNSMFPACMADGVFPRRLYGYDDRWPERTLMRYAKSHVCVARVVLRVRQPIYPMRVDGRLCFPVGEFTTSLCGDELRHALNTGAVAKVEAVAVFEAAPIFSAFIAWFWAARRKAMADGDRTRAWLNKILMNSLYGKFGQRGMHWDEASRTSDLSARSWLHYDMETGETVRYRQLCGLVQQRTVEGESRDSVPEIAACVTAAARLRLWRLMVKAGLDNVYYVDTDGLHLSAAGAAALEDEIDPAKLGALKVEGVFAEAEYRGAKDYRLGEVWKIKGVRKSAVEVSPGVFRQEQWSSLRGILAAGRLDDPTTRQIEKRLTRVYRKGVIADGGLVLPLSFSDCGVTGAPGGAEAGGDATTAREATSTK